MKGKLWVSVLAILLIFSGCANRAQKQVSIDKSEIILQAVDHYLSTTPENWRMVKNTWLKEKLDKGEVSDIFIVDIRSPESFSRGHIEGAINIPFKELAKKENLAKLPRDKTIVIVCTTGHSASMANVVLNLLGYKAVTMKYGMKGWEQENFPVVK